MLYFYNHEEYKYKEQIYFSPSLAYFPSSMLALQNSYYADREESVLAFIKQYPVNSEVDVYVNPDRPDMSVLDVSLKMPVFLTLLFGLFVIYCAIHLSLFGDRYFNVAPKKKRGV